MAFLNLTLELSKTNAFLERIAYALERIAGPELSIDSVKKRGADSLVHYGNEERTWVKEVSQGLIHERGLSPEEEERLLAETMAEYSEPPSPQDL